MRCLRWAPRPDLKFDDALSEWDGSALEKQASYDRLVFIEMNVADSMIGEGADALIADVVQMLDSREDLRFMELRFRHRT